MKGNLAARSMGNTYLSYQQLKKPSWSPPSWLFGPVWTVLYILIVISFGYTGWLFFNGKISFLILLPFILNLILNFSFTTIQFKLKNNLLAAADILLVLATLIWAMVAIYFEVHWIAYLQIPYFLWVSFATILQLTITYLNRK
jgi:tryptophan-rich sensory protein